MWQGLNLNNGPGYTTHIRRIHNNIFEGMALNAVRIKPNDFSIIIQGKE